MLPASNRGIGMSLNFPDVCKTPAPPAPFIPVPYPDLGMNMQAAPFSPFVFVQFVPATNMATLKVMTSGDEAGAMGGLITGLIKGPGKTTMGNPLVLVTGLPGESLATPTSGNAFNAPLGLQIVPSVVNVLYTHASAARELGSERDGLSRAHIRCLTDIAQGRGETADAARVRGEWLADGVAGLRIGVFSSHCDREVFNALRDLGNDAIRALVIDLRSNPGGDAEAAIRLASAFVPAGTVLLQKRHGDGDHDEVVARGGQSYPWPLALLLDADSASAAELFAGALQRCGRARLVGKATHGKASGQRAVREQDGRLRYRTVCEYLLPDGRRIEGRGVAPDVLVDDPDTIVEVALQALG